ncbi:hypothetical protein CR513_46009, partial [Mucuna pruriens]
MKEYLKKDYWHNKKNVEKTLAATTSQGCVDSTLNNGKILYSGTSNSSEGRKQLNMSTTFEGFEENLLSIEQLDYLGRKIHVEVYSIKKKSCVSKHEWNLTLGKELSLKNK